MAFLGPIAGNLGTEKESQNGHFYHSAGKARWL
jgi:hypothetical protein